MTTRTFKEGVDVLLNCMCDNKLSKNCTQICGFFSHFDVLFKFVLKKMRALMTCL